MKKKLLFLPFLAALAFAGCSNEDNLASGAEDPESGDLRYLAVNIVTPKESANTPMSRANDGDFQAGTADENAVTKALFILLNGNTVVETVTVSDLNPWSDGTGSVEKITSAVLVINGQDTKPTVNGILAVLNPPADLTITKNSVLDVNTLVANYGTATSGDFIMSNSVYLGGNNAAHIAETVTDKNLGRTEDAAKLNPVDIYVERVVAKITTNAVSDITTVGENTFNQGASVTMNGETTATPLKIDIKGVQIANCAQQSYLFKNIKDFTATAPWSGWNDAANHRSYWANMPQTGVSYENQSWNEISVAANALTAAHTFYAQENVLPYASTTGHTAVIVTAQLQKQNAAGNYEAFEFVKLANEYYAPEDALKQLAGYLNSRGYRVKTVTPAAEEGGSATTTYTTLDENCLVWCEHAPEGATEVEGWEGFAQLKTDYATGKTFAKYNANSTAADKYEVVEVAAINTELQGKDFRALKWTDGCCYYFVDIEHFGTETIPSSTEGATTTVKRKGIIRNHIYSLNLQSLKGLGVPVFDPTVDIIPEKPGEEELFYLAARINILKWVLVNQNVNFE